MSRGRARHHSSRRRAYSVRQREVRERRERMVRDEAAWDLDDPALAEPEPDAEVASLWVIRLQSRPSAA